ncbi:MAG: universal stress protein [Acidimicrobiales bacterium]
MELTTVVMEGHPARVLPDESKTASLVVVASRGNGEFAGMLLGSVSEFLTTHAHCPVVVRGDRAQQPPRQP